MTELSQAQSKATRNKKETYDAFLSHNNKDKEFVEAVQEKLEAAGLKVWIDKKGLSGGDPLPTVLKDALENSAACVAFVGVHGLGPWQAEEIEVAARIKRPAKRLIPVFLPNAERDLPSSLKDLLWIAFPNSPQATPTVDEATIARLVQDIREKAKGRNRWKWIIRITLSISLAVILSGLSWATFLFCTFQAEFAGNVYTDQDVEVVITRKLNPFGYLVGTGIFKKELRDAENGGINQHLRLNRGFAPDWKPLVDLVKEERLGLAEIEFHEDCSISKPQQFAVAQDAVGWGRVAPSVIDELTKLLKDKDRKVRYSAAKSLLQLRQSDPAMTEVFVEMFKDTNQDHQRRFDAAASLVQLRNNDSAVIDVVVKRLTDEDWRVRSVSAEYLVWLGKPDSKVIDALVKRLSDGDSDACTAAADALGKLGNRDAMVTNALLALVNDQDQASSVRLSAAESLRELGQSDSTVIDFLVAQLKEKDDYVCLRAAQSLGKKSAPKVIDALIAVAKDPDKARDVRRSAAESLGKLGESDTKAIDALLTLAKDPHQDLFVRLTALVSLEEVGKSDSTVIDVFVAVVKDQDHDTLDRLRAAESLGKLVNSNATVIDALVAQLKDPDRDIHVKAAICLVKFEKSDAFVALLKDQDPAVRRSAVEWLQHLGKPDAAVIDALIALLNDLGFFERVRVADSLGKSENSDVAIETLVALLRDEEAAVRFKAAESLGQLGQKRKDLMDDNQMIKHLAAFDSGVRERAGIVLAYRRQKVDSELTPEEFRYLQGIRDQVEGLRNDPKNKHRPWVKQASLHALYHIEKRKAELEAARRTSKQETAPSE